MRIIAGDFRRRQLETPPDAETTRPIPDRVKESLFQILRGHTEGATVFDGFSGTGAIGLEAISRGARHAVLVEKDRDVAEILRRNVATLGVADRCEVVQGDALGPGALARAMRPLHLTFLDPPYPLVQEPTGFRRVMAQMAALVALLDDTGYAVLRTPWPLVLQAAPHVEKPLQPDRPRKKKGRERDAWKQEIRKAQAGHDRKGIFGANKKSDARRTPAEVDEDGDSVEWLDDAELEAAQGEGGERAADVADACDAQSASLLPPPDLSVAGAVGPETHTYRGMAIHLYMKKK